MTRSLDEPIGRLFILFHLQPLDLSLNLILPSQCDIFWLVITEKPLQDIFNQETSRIVQDHGRRKNHLELGRKGNELQFLVNLRHEFRRAGKRNAGD